MPFVWFVWFVLLVSLLLNAAPLFFFFLFLSRRIQIQASFFLWRWDNNAQRVDVNNWHAIGTFVEVGALNGDLGSTIFHEGNELLELALVICVGWASQAHGKWCVQDNSDRSAEERQAQVAVNARQAMLRDDGQIPHSRIVLVAGQIGLKAFVVPGRSRFHGVHVDAGVRDTPDDHEVNRMGELFLWHPHFKLRPAKARHVVSHPRVRPRLHVN